MKASSNSVSSHKVVDKERSLSLCPPSISINVQVRVDGAWCSAVPHALKAGDVFRFCRQDGSALNDDRVYEAASPWQDEILGVDGDRVASGIRARLLPAA